MTTITQSITALPDVPDPATDTPATFSTKAAAFVLAQKTMATELETFRGQANTVAGEVSANAVAAAADAVEVAANLDAVLAAPGTNATSATSIAIGTGSKSITIQTGKAFVAGMMIVLADDAAPATNYMIGMITAYTSGSGALTFECTATGGSGTKSAWTLSLTGATFGATLGANTFTGVQTMKGIKETPYTITDGAAFEIDPANGTLQSITLTASRTPLATNFAAGHSVTLMIADGTAYTITWSGVAVTWVGGLAPVLATTGWTVIVLWKIGSTIYGAKIGEVA